MRWKERDTKLFYKCLEKYGLEFVLMSEILPNKSRKQLIKKYHNEFKKNKKKVEIALEHNKKMINLNWENINKIKD